MRHPERPPAGGGAGGPEGRGAAGTAKPPPFPPTPPPPALSAPHPRCGCATVGRSWGRREPSAAGRGGGRPFRFAHPSWNGRPRPERSGGSAPPCGVTAAGTAGRGAAAVSCVQTPLLSVQTPLRVQTPPALRRRDPPGGGRGSGPVSAPAARGEPRTPIRGRIPSRRCRIAAAAPAPPAAPPQPLLHAPTCQIKGDSPRGSAQRHFQG